MKWTNFTLLAAGLCLVSSAPLRAQSAGITFIGSASFSGTASDLSGLTGTYEDGTPKNRLGAFGSGIAFDPFTSRYVAVPDRGPNASTYNPSVDNTTSFDARFEIFTINVTPGTGAGGAGGTVAAALVATNLLTRENDGAHFIGLSSAFTGSNPSQNLRLDPEGVRVGANGNYFISDEYGPNIYRFNSAGQRLGVVTVPSGFLIANPANTGAAELPPSNTSGRQANRGMEGLAVTPDGRTLYGIMQSPLLQDGGLNASNSRVGTNIRILTVNIETGETHQFLYQLESASLGVSEIVAVNDHQFLVLERDGRGGTSAAVKELYLIDVLGATDISGVANLPGTGTPQGVAAVSKSAFLNLLDPAFGLAGSSFPEKIEGLAFGPDLPNGDHLLIVTNDNDFGTTASSNIYAFGISPSVLPGYVAQVPEPSSVALALLGAGCAALVRWRKTSRDR